MNKTVEHGKIKLVVTEATILIGMRRARLIEEARRVEDDDIDTRMVRIGVYPDLVAATVEASGLDWPVSFDTFLGLPEQLWDQWAEAVYELNPHWRPQVDDEKKA